MTNTPTAEATTDDLIAARKKRDKHFDAYMRFNALVNALNLQIKKGMYVELPPVAADDEEAGREEEQ